MEESDYRIWILEEHPLSHLMLAPFSKMVYLKTISEHGVSREFPVEWPPLGFPS